MTIDLCCYPADARTLTVGAADLKTGVAASGRRKTKTTRVGICWACTRKALSTDRQEMLIIVMLTRYFSVLWKLLEIPRAGKNNFQIAGTVGVSPFFVPEYLAAIKRYKPEELNNAFHALLEADTQIKSTSGSSMYIMQKMMISIIEGKSL